MEFSTISVPIDHERWAQACDDYRATLSTPEKRARFDEQKYPIWPYLIGSDGRLHPRWEPSGWTGRIYSKAPAVQTIPKPLRVGIQAPGKLIVSADWCGAHLRILAQDSGDSVLLTDLEGDVYRAIASSLFGPEVNFEQARSLTKRALLSSLNGAGESKLSGILGKGGHDVDGSVFKDVVRSRWSTAFEFLDQLGHKAERDGWVIQTPSGTEFEVPEGKRSRHVVPAGYLQAREVEALARVVEAGRRFNEKGVAAHLVILAHDETVWEVDPVDLERSVAAIRNVMSWAITRQKPGEGGADGIVDVTVGPSWGEQSGTTTAPEGEARGRTDIVQYGLRLVEKVANVEKPKEEVKALLEDRALRYNAEMAVLHDHGGFQLCLAQVQAATGGREAASALRTMAKRVKNDIHPFIARMKAKHKDKTELVFRRGDHTELAEHLLVVEGGLDAEGEPTGDVIADRGIIWKCDEDSGLWCPMGDQRFRVMVQRLAGSPVGAKRTSLKVSYNDTVAVQKAAMDRVHEEGRFDMQVDGVPFSNGLFTSEGCLRPYHRDDARMEGHVLPYAYKAESGCPRWLQFLEEVYEGQPDVEGRIQIVREFLGAALFGVATKFQKALYAVGDGSNGKSVLLDIVRALFNPNAVVAIAPQKMAGGSGDYWTATLATSMVNLVTELPERDLLESEAIKAAITGDVISGRNPYGLPFSFRPKAAWIIAANRLPAVRDVSHGFWRRPLILSHERKFVDGVDADPKLREKLLKELPGIAAWAVQGGLDLMERGHYPVLKSSDKAIADWRRSADSVARFAGEHLERDPEAKYRAHELYETYREWTRANGYSPVNSRNFGERAKASGFEWRRDKAGRYYQVRLVEDWRVKVDPNVEEAIEMLDRTGPQED